MKRFFTLLFLTSVLLSCEKKIDVNIKNAKPKLVVSGFITNENKSHTINITKSGNINDVNFEYVNNASITISDNEGNIYPLTLTDSGKYTTPIFQGISGNIYTLNILHENNSYEAISIMPELVPLNSIDYIEENFSFDKKISVIYYYWTDPVATGNYYRYFDHVKGQTYLQSPTEYQLYDDRFSNGNNIERDGYETYNSGDTVVAHLVSIDENVHRYYEQLSDVASGGPGGQGIPYNPQTNFNSNEVLGYFGAWNIDTLQIIIP